MIMCADHNQVARRVRLCDYWLQEADTVAAISDQCAVSGSDDRSPEWHDRHLAYRAIVGPKYYPIRVSDPRGSVSRATAVFPCWNVAREHYLAFEFMPGLTEV